MRWFSLRRLAGGTWFVAALFAGTVVLALAAIEASVETQNYQRGLLDASAYNATFDYSRAQIEVEKLARLVEGFGAGRADRDELEIGFAVVKTRLDTLPVTINGRPFKDAVAARDELAATCDEIAARLPRTAGPAMAEQMAGRLETLARTFSRLATTANAVQGDIIEGWRTRLSSALVDVGISVRLLCGFGFLLLATLVSQKLYFRRQALTDPLTGLPNRASFRDWSHRAAGAKEIAIAVVDVDLFKEINDSCGHQRGDQLLCQLGALFREVTGLRSEVARIGGDEFALLFVGPGAHERAETACTMVTRRLAVLQGTACDERRPTLSIGLAASKDGSRDLEALLLEADAAMYAAKSSGGAAIVQATDEFRSRLEQRRRLQRDIASAVSRGEFETVFQPIVDVGTLRAHGFETLLRWHHPEFGRLAPDFFIPLAEETGAIVEIGRFVLDRALAIAANWPRQLTVSVNVSAVQLGDRAFVSHVKNSLARHGVAAHRLILEITETVLIRNANAKTVIDELRSLGVGIALDDFGTGYASMGYLRQYRFDKIKIDKSFVSTMNQEGKSAAIVRAICSLARDISATVVAEGIETEELLGLVDAAGCELGQGYLFARPMSALQTSRFIERYGWCASAPVPAAANDAVATAAAR
ncbi:putative bifunctional diguanylate cyclase/phosphodiesterase [Jiella sonneratiae]|uniref:Bifunctional diguanylate cyclase/phosphodiesterase n=1 Tax=Jiella sonneratiae TaxID=2816856 RepID=A0ABS3J235_9HYPH|nr:bifunctional diguanylate cyclase/phosphodiesterase [Jiella sonneratiae]MBO0903157.1 bifunctional diguanylate cyclase/phosphodiesterase [Jiella sonneratiae]